MTDIKSKKYKHLTLEERQEIMECLDKGMTFKAIARRIKKDPTTVSKEVKKHLTVVEATVKHTKGDGTPIEPKPNKEGFNAKKKQAQDRTTPSRPIHI